MSAGLCMARKRKKAGLFGGWLFYGNLHYFLASLSISSFASLKPVFPAGTPA